ncbi:MAG: hypothetical protein ACRDQ5_25515, partial [Sciscionella sp.]
ANAAVYNECKALVEDARKIEKRAHDKLCGSAAAVTGATTELVSIGATVTSRMLGQLSSMENPRRDVANVVERLTNQSKFLTDWAYGKVDSANPLFKRTLELAATKSRNSVQYRERVTEFEKFLSTVPQEARAAITAYPGKAALDSAPVPTTATRALSAMPYLGGILTAANEARGALTGEQSWGKAAVDTAAITAGSAVGAAGAGALAGAILGAPAGPVGGFVVGTIGGIAGAVGGQKVVDAFVPG